MAPRKNQSLWRFVIIVISLLPGMVLARPVQRPDSLQIYREDSLAFHIYLSRPDSAIATARRMLERSQQMGFRQLEGLSYYILSKAYWAKADFRKSAEFGFRALKIFENTSQVNLWGKSLLSLSRTLIDLKSYQQASLFIDRALMLCRHDHDPNLLAETYREKSMLLSETGKYDSALMLADKGLALFEKLQDSLSVSILYGRKAKIHFLKKEYSKSKIYNRKSLLLDSITGNRRALGISYYQAGLDAVYLKNMDSALIFLKKSIPINQEMRNLLTLIKVHELLADIHLGRKQPDLAARELKLVSQYKDSLYHAERAGQIQEMLSLYELNSKEQTIEQLSHESILREQQFRNQSWFVAFLLLCVVLSGLAIFFLARFRRLQGRTNVELASKNKAIEQQKEEIQAQTETLQQLNDLKTKLFSVISHDLRGPMASLHSLLDLLSRKKMTPEEFISVADKLKNNLDVTQRTLENLLNWSLSQMEGIRTDPNVIDIRDTIEETCHLMNEIAGAKKIRIVNNVEDSLLVTVDSNHLQLILRNIIHNAIKFSRQEEIIFVSASREMDFCLISVRDTGIGMSQREVETIIGSSNHFSKVGTHQEKGTGLGLLLCKEFIKLNGGEINILSTINKGTTVIFTLPLARQVEDKVVFTHH